MLRRFAVLLLLFVPGLVCAEDVLPQAWGRIAEEFFYAPRVEVTLRGGAFSASTTENDKKRAVYSGGRFVFQQVPTGVPLTLTISYTPVGKSLVPYERIVSLKHPDLSWYSLSKAEKVEAAGHLGDYKATETAVVRTDDKPALPEKLPDAVARAIAVGNAYSSARPPRDLMFVSPGAALYGSKPETLKSGGNDPMIVGSVAYQVEADGRLSMVLDSKRRYFKVVNEGLEMDDGVILALAPGRMFFYALVRMDGGTRVDEARAVEILVEHPEVLKLIPPARILRFCSENDRPAVVKYLLSKKVLFEDFDSAVQDALSSAKSSDVRKLLEVELPTVGDTWTNAIGMTFSWCPPGEFEMGSPANEEGRRDNESPVHGVRIPRGFWLGTYEVTQGQWRSVMGSNPSRFQGSEGDERRPVEQVSWDDCQQFLKKLALSDGKRYRLPTEAEWEYACRAGTTTALYSGRLTYGSDLDPIAWWINNSQSEHPKALVGFGLPAKHATQPVGGKRPNQWGLFDMLGNVLEWCQDTWHDDYKGAPADGSAWVGKSPSHVLRGSCFVANDARLCRAALRLGGPQPLSDHEKMIVGLRVIVSPGTVERAAVKDFGIVDLRVEPGEAVVTLDGEPAPLVGGRGWLRVRPGQHVLRASREHHEDASETVVVGDGATATVQLVLKEISKGSPIVGRVGETRTNSIGMSFSWCPPGEFEMGSPADEPGRADNEGPVHRVTIPQGFWLGTYEVTQGEWQLVMSSSPWKTTGSRMSGAAGDENHPVDCVSRSDCQEFIKKLAAQDGNNYRLPSEAEWEYACRAGTTGERYNAGMNPQGEGGEPELKQIAWYVGSSFSTHPDSLDLRRFYPELKSGGLRVFTHPVGERQPNPWGLYDMLGNVGEWCLDSWHDSYVFAPTNGRPWFGDADTYVVRGGFFGSPAQNCRCGSRGAQLDHWAAGCGFRVVAVPGPAGHFPVVEQGLIDLRVEPGDVVVSLDGERKLVSGGRVQLRVRPGRYVLAASRENYEDVSETVTVSGGVTASVLLVLKEKPKGPPVPASGRVGETWTNSIGMQFSWCPPGEFDMGSPASEPGRYDWEGPVHRVRIPRGFWMGTHEVTQGEWQAVMGSNPAKFTGDDRRPVEQVSWSDCQEFVGKLASRDGNGYRLPSETEWEYACRAGTAEARYGDLDAVAWYDKNSGGKTQSVGEKRPNAWGLYDMLGNVWEWCQDTWNSDYSGAPTDGSAWDGGSGQRVLRGGSWRNIARDARAAYRYYFVPDSRYRDSGLRVIVLPRTP